MGAKPYTAEEIQYIEDRWGVLSIKAIAKHLGRSFGGLKNKAAAIGLTDPRKHIDGITIYQLSVSLGIEYGIITKHWIPLHDFPVKTKVTCKTAKYKYVTFKDFWKWAEQNKKLLNFSRLEEGELGEEPKWVAQRRKMDKQDAEKKVKRPWTDLEKKRLIYLVKQQKYTVTEIAETLDRSEAAVNRKLWQYKLLDRPLAHEDRLYEPEEISVLLEMREKGHGWNTIGKQLDRSVQSVRRKYARLIEEQRRVCNG